MDARAISDRLICAEDTATPITPFTDGFPFLHDDVAYRAQWLSVQHRLDAGERLVGAKLGMTSGAVRRALNVHEPVYGWLTANMVGTDGELDSGGLIHPRVEPEIALQMAGSLTAPVSVDDVIETTEYVVGAIEVLDSRFLDYRYRRSDVIADNVGASRVVLGTQRRRPDEVEDLALIGCLLQVNGEVVATAAGGAALGHPAAAVAWLVNALAKQGRSLPDRALVLTGGLTSPIPLLPGRPVQARFAGLGSVEVDL